MTAEPEMLSHIPERRIGSAVEDEKGFTLLEILIAIFIFAIVMTTIYSAFNAVIAKNEAINQGRGLYEMTRNCLDRMTRDLTAIYVEQPPQYEPRILTIRRTLIGLFARRSWWATKIFLAFDLPPTRICQWGKRKAGVLRRSFTM